MYQRYSKANRRRKGLSIIEVTMASVLLIVAMAPILVSLTKANLWSTQIEQKTQSLVLAQGKLDNIRANAVYNFGSSGSFTANNVVLKRFVSLQCYRYHDNRKLFEADNRVRRLR